MNDQDVDAGEEVESEFSGEGSSRQAILSSEEVRVLGCLIEKEMTTPEYYPLTLNALTAACNQKSNREPVTGYESATVAKAMEKLRYKGLAISVHEAGSRGAKNKHTLDRVHPLLTRAHLALLAVLMLRGQQTLGELRQRTERMHAISDLESVQAALDVLILYDPEPLVKLIPAGGGRRVETYGHLLAGETGGMSAAAEGSASAPSEEAASPSWREVMEETIEALRGEVAELREELGALRREVAVLRAELGALRERVG